MELNIEGKRLEVEPIEFLEWIKYNDPLRTFTCTDSEFCPLASFLKAHALPIDVLPTRLVLYLEEHSYPITLPIPEWMAELQTKFFRLPDDIISVPEIIGCTEELIREILEQEIDL